MKHLILIILLILPLSSFAGDCNGFRPFHGGVASQGAHARASCTCESCHTGGFNAGTAPRTCVGCHMGQKPTATQKPANHIQTGSIGCESCHSASLMQFTPATMNHNVVAGQACNSCHGVSTIGKPSGHITTASDCITCHKSTSNWDARMNHTGITTGCSNCHQKSSSHIATGLECTVCHNTGFTSWSCSP